MRVHKTHRCRWAYVTPREEPREGSHRGCTLHVHACMHGLHRVMKRERQWLPRATLLMRGSLFFSFFSLFCFFLRLPFFFVQNDELCKTSANTRLLLARKERSPADNHRYRLQIREMRITTILIQTQHESY